MFRKNSVSLYLLPKRILVLQASNDKKKVVKHASVELPEGLIKDFKVENPQELAKVIKSIWSKFGFKEKSVSLVVPEFSTFSKLLKIPKIPISELDEAVRWQAQEYLPSALETQMLDWKIVGKTPTSYEVLIIAIPKEILSSYIGSAEYAGLFPSVVETPSVCLSRLVADDHANLIIYRNFGESILIISDKERILGTSVLQSKEIDEIVNTSYKMVSHFKDVEIGRIMVSGLEVDQDMLNKLSLKLKKQVDWIKPGIGGLSEDDIQEYIIPISMQLAPPSVPSDPASINLLPAPLVEKYKRAKLGVQIWSLTLTITLFVWISFLLTLGSYLFLVQQIRDLKQKSDLITKLAERQKLTIEVRSINDTIDKILKIKDISISPQDVISAVEQAIPAGVSIDSYNLDLDLRQVKLDGTSQNRDSLIEFKRKLEENPLITSVEIPISSFESEINLKFKVNFEYSQNPNIRR